MEREDLTPRETFLRDLEPFFSGGLAHEVYFHEGSSIMNFANGFYVGSMYFKDESGNQVGIIIPKTVAYASIEDWLYFLKWFNALSLDEKVQCVMLFNSKTLEVAKKIKASTDIEGPATDVDLEWEERLKRGKLSRPPCGFLQKIQRFFRGRN